MSGGKFDGLDQIFGLVNYNFMRSPDFYALFILTEETKCVNARRDLCFPFVPQIIIYLFLIYAIILSVTLCKMLINLSQYTSQKKGESDEAGTREILVMNGLEIHHGISSEADLFPKGNSKTLFGEERRIVESIKVKCQGEEATTMMMMRSLLSSPVRLERASRAIQFDERR